jgi:hypothetical protein
MSHPDAPSVIRRPRRGLLIGLSLLSVASLSYGVACNTELGCVADSQCPTGLVCANTECVGPQVTPSSDPFALYREELHNRLAADCGICHGVRGAGSSAGRYEVVADTEEGQQRPLEVLNLPAMSVALGDSAWRIYLDDLTDDRLIASYQDTAEFINLDDPARSLLLAYARGEVNVRELKLTRPEREAQMIPASRGIQHPVIYEPAEETPVSDCLSSLNAEVPAPLTLPLPPEAPPPTVARLSYERLLSWVQLSGHTGYVGAKRLNLERYQAQAQAQVQSLCFGCHNPTSLARDGFCFVRETTTASELHLLAPLINHTNLNESAILGFLDGQFDHTNLSKTPEQKEAFRQALSSWLQAP